MSSRLIGSLVAIAAFFMLIFAVVHYRDKANTVTDKYEKAVITTRNVLLVVDITNHAREANSNAKSKIALESQRATSDIKDFVKSDDCAIRPVSNDAVKRLREHAANVRAIADRSATK